MMNEFDSNQVARDIGGAVADYLKPHVMMRPKVFIDGDEWCALYGENLQEGVSGFGRSPELACQAFDMNWSRPLPKAG